MSIPAIALVALDEFLFECRHLDHHHGVFPARDGHPLLQSAAGGNAGAAKIVEEALTSIALVGDQQPRILMDDLETLLGEPHRVPAFAIGERQRPLSVLQQSCSVCQEAVLCQTNIVRQLRGNDCATSLPDSLNEYPRSSIVVLKPTAQHPRMVSAAIRGSSEHAASSRLPRWKLPLGHFDIVRGEPLTIKFPARVLDTGLREDDRARFSLYFAEQRLRGNERRIVGILGIDFRIENGQRLERRYLDVARRTDERRFASDFQDPELVGVALQLRAALRSNDCRQLAKRESGARITQSRPTSNSRMMIIQ